MPGMTHRPLEDVARRLETVFGPWSHVDESHEWDLQQRAISLVRVYGISGSIAVRGATGDRASLHVRKVIHIPQVGTAEAFASRVRVRFHRRNQRLFVRVHYPRPPLGGRVFVHLTLRVPHAVDVDLRASRGPLSIDGIEGAVQANTRSGNITARDCLGPVSLVTGDGIVDVGDVEGGLSVQCGRGTVRFDTITGRVRLRADRADVTAHGVRGEFDARVRQGDVALTGGGGQVRFQTGIGDVRAAFGAGHRDVTLSSRQGDLTLSLGAVEGEVRAEINRGDVGLTLDSTFTGRLEATTRTGQVRAALSGGRTLSSGNHFDVQVGGASGARVRVVSTEGDIRVSGAQDRWDVQHDGEGDG
jgi:hypothetical protein